MFKAQSILTSADAVTAQQLCKLDSRLSGPLQKEHLFRNHCEKVRLLNLPCITWEFLSRSKYIIQFSKPAFCYFNHEAASLFHPVIPHLIRSPPFNFCKRWSRVSYKPPPSVQNLNSSSVLYRVGKKQHMILCVMVKSLIYMYKTAQLR